MVPTVTAENQRRPVMGTVTTVKPLRIRVWAADKETLRTLATRQDWNRARLEAAANGHGYWMYQPGAKTLFEGFISCFVSDFDKEVLVTQGYGEAKTTVLKKLPYARARQ